MSARIALRTATDPALRGHLSVAAICVAAAGVVGLVDPLTTHIPLCPLHAMTGLDCPFCGSLRAVFELTRGNLAAAGHDNCLFVAVLPILAMLWLDGLGRRATALPARRWPVTVRALGVAVAVGFVVVRNLPGFSVLRPLA